MRILVGHVVQRLAFYPVRDRRVDRVIFEGDQESRTANEIAHGVQDRLGGRI